MNVTSKQKNTKLIVDSKFEIQNGLLGMMRDVVLRLCRVIERQKNVDYKKKDQCVRAVIGVCQENAAWKTHSHFIENRIQFINSKKMSYATQLFNDLKFKEGIESFIKVGVCSNSPESIALFLLNAPDLSKRALGEYLAGRSPPCPDVLKAYGALLPMSGMNFDDALRLFLSGFTMVREAQKIEKYLAAFAKCYVDKNPISFENIDHACTLAYLLVLTDSSRARGILGKAEFISMAAKCGTSENDLEAMYNRLVTKEICMSASKG